MRHKYKEMFRSNMLAAKAVFIIAVVAVSTAPWWMPKFLSVGMGMQ